MRERLIDNARVVVIGASRIGAEVACAALALGRRVTCAEVVGSPPAAALGTEVGTRLPPGWTGIDPRLGTAAREVEDGGVRPADGTFVPADVVVTGVGVPPATGWLEGRGLRLDRETVVDEHLRAGHDRGIRPRGRRRAAPAASRELVRVRHWDSAAILGAAAAGRVSPSSGRPGSGTPTGCPAAAAA
nr:FAD-dependent oxidoreductase [Actinomadura sp. NBRC 104425]